MSHSLKILAGAAALAALSGAAFAADLSGATPPYSPAPAYAQQGFSWTGPYAGVLAGYGWGHVGGDDDIDGSGFLAGGFVGYNAQVSGPWVLGVEGDLAWSGIGGDDGSAAFDTGWLSTLRARGGYAFDRFMVYGTGGLAVGDVNVAGYSNTRTGYAVGAGLEGAVTDNVIARVEYLYTDLGEDNYGGFNDSFTSHQIRAGLGLKF